MAFSPKFTITNKLLASIKEVNRLVTKLNFRRFPQVILVELHQRAQALSAHTSTSIEGNTLPLTEVKKLLKNTPKNVRDSQQEILNYNQALISLDKKLDSGLVKLTRLLILSLHKAVTQKLLPTFESGHYRQKPVVVHDPKTKNIIFLPPDHGDVPALIDDLIQYVKTSTSVIDPLILAGIFHKQFVLIHPFMDGNGRTTRLATKALLANMGLNTLKLFSFENYYNQNVTKYFSLVGETGNYYDLIDQVDFTPWLEYFIDGLIDELLRISALLPQVSQSPETELLADHQRLLEFISQKGFATDADYATLTKRAKATRTLDFQKLIDLGLITRQGMGKNTHYVLKEI